MAIAQTHSIVGSPFLPGLPSGTIVPPLITLHWSLITGKGGGGYNTGGGGGASEVLHLRKVRVCVGGGGGAQGFHPLKGEELKVLPRLVGGGGGAQKVLVLDFPIL